MKSTDTDRPRGLFSNTDREWLLGETTYDTRQSTYERRRAIRERIQHGLLDFPVLLDNLSEHDRNVALERDRYPHHEKLLDSVVAMLAFAYEITEYKGWDFDRVLEDAVNEAHRPTGRSPAPGQVSVKDNIVRVRENFHWRHSLRRAHEKWESGRVTSLTDAELRLLIEYGRMDTSAIIDTYRKQRREELQERRWDEHEKKYVQKLEMLGFYEDEEEQESC